MKLTGPLSEVAMTGPRIVLVSQIAGRSRTNDADEALPNVVNKRSPVRTTVRVVLKRMHRKDKCIS
jgi:hypothetical protein